MKKRVLTAAAAGLMSASMILSAFAASEGGAKPYSDGTDVYAGVILKDVNEDARLRVYVPTLFAFVVNGSVDANTKPISVENDNLLLPNVKVAVDDDTSITSNHRDYSIQTVGEGHMYFENCSTALVKGERKGVAVSVKGSIKNEGTLESRNYWEHIGTAPSSNAGEDFKKYRLSVDDIKFSESKDGAFEMSEAIALEAPDLGKYTDGQGKIAYTNKDSDDYAITGATKDVEFGVEVGGVQGDYRQVEESAKVGSIVWTISYDIDNDDDTVKTAPDNTYQSVAGEQGTLSGN